MTEGARFEKFSIIVRALVAGRFVHLLSQRCSQCHAASSWIEIKPFFRPELDDRVQVGGSGGEDGAGALKRVTSGEQALELQLPADVGQPAAKERSRDTLLLQLTPERVVAVVGLEALLAASEEGVNRTEAELVGVDPLAARRWPNGLRDLGLPSFDSVSSEAHGARQAGRQRGPDRLDVLTGRHQADEHQLVVLQCHLVETGLNMDRLAIGPFK